METDPPALLWGTKGQAAHSRLGARQEGIGDTFLNTFNGNQLSTELIPIANIKFSKN